MNSLLIFVICAGAAFWTMVLYRDVKKYRAQVDNAWSQVTAQLEERNLLASNLADAASSYMNGQVEPLKKALLDRTAAAKENDFSTKRQSEEALSHALNSFLETAVSQADFSTNSDFTTIRKRLVKTDERIRLVNEFYNNQALVYNTRISIMPERLVAQCSGFKPAAFFDVHI